MYLEVSTETKMHKLGGILAAWLAPGDLVYLLGNLGAGKTTLVRGLVHALGYPGRVSSPTFTLMNLYPTIPPVYHFDFYRLEDGDLNDLGLEDYLERDGIALIEWPNLEAGNLPAEALVVEIEIVDGDYDRERRVHITARGKRYEEKLERLMQLVDTGY